MARRLAITTRFVPELLRVSPARERQSSIAARARPVTPQLVWGIRGLWIMRKKCEPARAVPFAVIVDENDPGLKRLRLWNGWGHYWKQSTEICWNPRQKWTAALNPRECVASETFPVDDFAAIYLDGCSVSAGHAKVHHQPQRRLRAPSSF